jgi:hypothetical protein
MPQGRELFPSFVNRINPKGGYTKSNIQIVSYWYNTAKLNWEEEVFISMRKSVAAKNV